MRSALALAAVLAALPAAGRAAEPATQPPAPAPQKSAAPAEKKGPADLDRSLYAVGLSISKSLEVFSLSPAELNKVVQGLKDGAAGKPKFPLDEKAQQAVNDLGRARLSAAADQEKGKAAGYLADPLEGEGRREDRVRRDRDPREGGHRRVSDRRGQGEGALHGQARGREGLRLVGAARPTGGVPAERRREVLDGGAPEDEGRREGDRRVPVRDRVRRAGARRR